ncbi:hypothetical protein [Bradyrhizobium australiense]|uniref:Uncharacterized protein n=1 Tax=Bradyrhizobium australiense TaxID=2721161 RepID=A0A7Y4GZJ6_9BRAD|nr:hypothetical protein [Bradyrhizobium australiense]NOJ44542.1 hypothetical protein [Bradyrhizobium australiense]
MFVVLLMIALGSAIPWTKLRHALIAAATTENMQDHSGQQPILDRNLMVNGLALTSKNVSANDAQSMKRNSPYFRL